MTDKRKLAAGDFVRNKVWRNYAVVTMAPGYHRNSYIMDVRALTLGRRIVTLIGEHSKDYNYVARDRVPADILRMLEE